MNKKKGIFIGIIISLLLVVSLGAISLYGTIEKISMQPQGGSWSEEEGYYITSKLLVLDAELNGYTTDEQLLEHYFYIDEEKIAATPEDQRSLTIEDDQRLFLEEFKSWRKQYKDDSNFAYAYKKIDTPKGLSNVDLDLFTIDADEKISDQYQRYLYYSFDENGVLQEEVSTYPAMISSVVNEKDALPFNLYLNSSLIVKEMNEDGYTHETQIAATKIKSPKNTQFVCAVPNEIKREGLYYNSVYSSSFSEGVQACIALLGVAIASILSIFMLFYPIRIVKECNPYKTLGKIKIEFLGFLLFGGIILSMILNIMFSEVAILGVDVQNTIPDLFPSSDQFYLFSIVLWFVFGFLVTMAIYELKMIFHVGLTAFIKDYTCVGWIYKKIVQLIQFDLNDPHNRTLLKIIGLNFIIMSIVSFFFNFGFLFFFVYSCVLFVLFRDKLTSIQRDYQVILKATKQLSKGDFDVDIKENVGMFTSLANDLSNVKEGYKTAVKEEVKSQKMKTELISNVSHDLKTPLTSIITYIDLLKKEDLSEEQKIQYIDVLDRNSTRLKQLIEDLFEVSKANSGDVSLNKVEVDIVSLMKQALFECDDALSKQTLDIRTSYALDKMICLLDSAKTYRVFENLLINISKYSLPQTRVFIDVYEENNEACIVLKNISAHEMQFDGYEIVERFVQGDTSRTNGGSGLGLAIAKSFTEIQGGSFKVEIDGDLFKVFIKYPIVIS